MFFLLLATFIISIAIVLLCSDDNNCICIGGCLFGLIIIFTFTTYIYGYHKINYNEMEKQDIIENYIDCPCEYHLNKAKSYNKEINIGNNTFCRFKIEDRTQYLININELLNYKEETHCTTPGEEEC